MIASGGTFNKSGLHEDSSAVAMTLHNLSFRHAGSTTMVLQNLTLSLGRGEIVAIMGPSGCGKSTLLDIVAGLLTPVQGSLSLNMNERERQVGYIFQRDALLPWRSVESNMLMA